MAAPRQLEFPYERQTFNRLSLAMLLPRLQTYLRDESKDLHIELQVLTFLMPAEADYIRIVSRLDLDRPPARRLIQMYYRARDQYGQLRLTRGQLDGHQLREERIAIVSRLTEVYHGFLKIFLKARQIVA